MRDFTLAAQAAFEAEDQKATRASLKSDLNRHPKSIQLHQINARTFLAIKDAKSAEQSFGILKLLYPNLLVKLNYEESLIWEKHEHPTHAHQAPFSAGNVPSIQGGTSLDLPADAIWQYGYFLKEINGGTTGYQNLNLKILARDGAFVYLNGQYLGAVNLFQRLDENPTIYRVR